MTLSSPFKMQFLRSIVWMAICLLILVSAMILGAACSWAGERKVTVDDIVQQLRQNEKRFELVVLEWEDKIFAAKDEALAKGGAGKFPSQDVASVETQVLKFKGQKRRLETQGAKGFNSNGELVQQDQTSVFNKDILKSYMPTGTVSHPLGNIHSATPAQAPRRLNLQAAFYLLRPITTKLFDPGKCKVQDKRALVNELDCVVVEGTDAAGIWTYYFSVERDLALVRWTITQLGSILIRSDFSYREDDKHGWLPEKWEIVVLHPPQSVAATVKRLTVSEPIDDAEFEFEFPPGTLVRDYTTRSSYGDRTHYIARENGEKRVVKGQDVDASYEELLDSESGKAKTKSARPTIGVPTLVMLAILAFGLLALLYRKIKHGYWTYSK